MTTTSSSRRREDQLPPTAPVGASGTPSPAAVPLYSNANVTQKLTSATTTTTTMTTPTPHQLNKINGMFIRDQIGVEFFQGVLGSAEMINKNFTPVRIVKRSDSYEYAGVINTTSSRRNGGVGGTARQGGTPTAAAAATSAAEGPIRSMPSGFVSEQPNTSRNLMRALTPLELYDDLDLLDDQDDEVITSDADSNANMKRGGLMTSDNDDDYEHDEDDNDKTWSIGSGSASRGILNNAVLLDNSGSGCSTIRTADSYRTASDNINNDYMEVIDDELRQLDLYDKDKDEKHHYIEPIVPLAFK